MMNWLIFLFNLFFLSFTCVAQFQFEHNQEVVVEKDSKRLSLAWAGGLNTGQYQTIDANYDGKDDLVIFDRTSNKPNVFIHIDGGYVYAPEFEIFFPDDLDGWIVLADYDCDGKKDLFTNSLFGIRVFRNISSENYPQWQQVYDPIFTQGTSGPTNLQVNITDIPAITDMDSDGDLDILIFDPAGGELVEYHKNTSIENGNLCGIEYVRVSRNWGNFRECDCSFSFGTPCPIPSGGKLAKPMHAGGKSILAFDADGDGDKDVLIGHEECEQLFYLENAGSRSEALMVQYTDDYPVGNPASFNIFPAGYYEDVDFDGIKDLMVAPNVSQNITDKINFKESSWFYKNTGTTSNPSFTLQQKDFLQAEMIDAGEGAAPAFADSDGDGDLDMFIGHKGNQGADDFFATIQYYENTGSRSEPKFKFVTDDYLNLSALKLRNIKPQFVDLNGDNRTDLVFTGTQQIINSNTYFVETKIYFLENMAVSGSGMTFQLSNLKTLHNTIGYSDQPLFADINNDGAFDLLLAKPQGNLEYYQKISATYELKEKNYLGIVEDYRRSNLSVVVADLDADGEQDLVTVDISDTIRIYSSFLKPNSTSVPLMVNNPVSKKTESIKSGMFAKITFADLYFDRRPAMIIGNNQGGLNFYKNVSQVGSSNEDQFTLSVRPNVYSGVTPIHILADKDANLDILAVTGQIVYKGIKVQSGKMVELDVTSLMPGLYIVRGVAADGNGRDVKKIIISK